MRMLGSGVLYGPPHMVTKNKIALEHWGEKLQHYHSNTWHCEHVFYFAAGAK